LRCIADPKPKNNPYKKRSSCSEITSASRTSTTAESKRFCTYARSCNGCIGRSRGQSPAAWPLHLHACACEEDPTSNNFTTFVVSGNALSLLFLLQFKQLQLDCSCHFHFSLSCFCALAAPMAAPSQQSEVSCPPPNAGRLQLTAGGSLGHSGSSCCLTGGGCHQLCPAAMVATAAAATMMTAA